jgi:hypothetical protein
MSNSERLPVGTLRSSDEPTPNPPTAGGVDTFKPGWHNVIPTIFNDLCAGMVGAGLIGAILWLVAYGPEQLQQLAAQTIFAGFTLYLGWAIRGRVEAAKNQPRQPESGGGVGR